MEPCVAQPSPAPKEVTYQRYRRGGTHFSTAWKCSLNPTRVQTYKTFTTYLREFLYCTYIRSLLNGTEHHTTLGFRIENPVGSRRTLTGRAGWGIGSLVQSIVRTYGDPDNL